MRYLWLDLLRGCAAGYVVMFHILGSEIKFVQPGWLSVDLFFILSGFVLSKALESGTNSGIKGYIFFLKSRILRIGPMLLVALTLTFVVKVIELIYEFLSGNVGDEPAFVAETPLYFLLSILLIQFIHPVSCTILVPLWSLSAEFYVNVLAALLGFTGSARRLSIGFFLGILFIYISGISFEGQVDWTRFNTWIFGFGRALSGFTLGIFVWKLYSKNSHANRATNYLLLVFSIVLCSFTWINWRSYILVPSWIFFSITILVFARLENPKFDRIPFKIFSFFGHTSYGVYLLHIPVLTLFNSLVKFSDFFLFVLVYVSTIFLSYISETFFIPPIKKAFFQRLKF